MGSYVRPFISLDTLHFTSTYDIDHSQFFGLLIILPINSYIIAFQDLK